MIAFALLGGFAGLILGLRYKILILVPASGLALVGAMPVALLLHSPWLISALVLIGPIQLGYIAASAMRTRLFDESASTLQVLPVESK
jgi:hypothetical protein